MGLKIPYELKNQKEWDTDNHKSEYQSDDDSEESYKDDSEESYSVDDDNKLIESVPLHLGPGLMGGLEFLKLLPLFHLACQKITTQVQGTESQTPASTRLPPYNFARLV